MVGGAALGGVGTCSWAFTSSNYISEHLDCLFHSIHFEMKALSLVSFPFHMVQKRGLFKVPFPVALEKSQVLQTFQALRRNNSAGSGCTEGKEILCRTCSNKFCH